MEERKKKTHGLLSDYGALYAVAKESGINLNEGKVSVTKIKDIAAQRPVNVLGRIKKVFSPREFTRKDGGTGKFASIVLLDDTGEIRLVLWDQNTEVTKKAQVGGTLMAKNAFARENNGVLEVHAGSLTNIALDPKVDAELPKVEETLFKVGDLDANLSSVNIILRVNSYYPKTEFNRSDGTTGSRASFIGEDESGKIRAVLWDNMADTQISPGDFVKIENGYTREGLSGETELMAGNRSRAVKSDAKIDLPELTSTQETLKISDIGPNLRGFNVAARVIRVYPPREYSNGMMASLIVGDESGTIRAVLWDDKSKIAEELKVNDSVTLSNAYSKANMTDEAEIHIGKYGNVSVREDLSVPDASEIERSQAVEKKIADLDLNDRGVKVTAKVVEVDEDKPIFYMACPGCGKRVQNLGGTWLCDACGDVDPDTNLLASVILEDESGSVRAVAFRENAEKVLGMDVGSVMNLIGETQDESAPLKKAKESVPGKQFSFVGRMKYNEFSDQLELIVDDVV